MRLRQFPALPRLPRAALTQPKQRCDVAYQRCAARADAAVARARGADRRRRGGGEGGEGR